MLVLWQIYPLSVVAQPSYMDGSVLLLAARVEESCLLGLHLLPGFINWDYPSLADRYFPHQK